MNRRATMHRAGRAVMALMLAVTFPAATRGQQAPAAGGASQAAQTGLLIENVRIFNGTDERLSPVSQVLVVGNLVRTISTSPIAPPANVELTRIDGGGCTLMPGLIDAHTHLMFATISQQVALLGDFGFVQISAARAAHLAVGRLHLADGRAR